LKGVVLLLNVEDYKKINQFKDTIHQYSILDPNYNAFRRRTSVALEDIFNYRHILFGYLDRKKTKEISFEVFIHNIDLEFTQKFLSSSLLNDKVIHNKSDVFVLSHMPDYKSRVIYLNLMKHEKYSDFIIFYLSVRSVYVGFIILFKEDQQKIITEKEVEITKQLMGFISVEYNNFVECFYLKADNSRLLSYTNYYPIGIVIMRDYKEMAYANEIALTYMQELGIKELKYFFLFFSNYILPVIKYEMRSMGKKRILRHKNFVFSIVTLNSFHSNDFEDIELHAKNIPNIFTHIYIMKDELSSMGDGQPSLNEYAFSNKEQEIVERVIRGKSNKQIAEEMDISINTVRVHINNIYKKCDVSNRTEFLFKINNSQK